MSLDVTPLSLKDAISYVQAMNHKEDVKTDASYTELVVADIDMHISRVNKLTDALHENTTLTGLQITCSEWPHCGLGDDGAEAVCKSLECNTKLRTLMLNNCKLSSCGGVSIANLLSLGRSLTHLNLDNNNLEAEGVKHIAKALSASASGLRRLDLRGNEIGSLGAVDLAMLIARCSNLQHLGVGFNDLGDEGIFHIADALRTTDHLQSLDISDNKITQAGCYVIANILNMNNSLQHFDMSGNDASGDSDVFLASALTSAKSLTRLEARKCRIDQDGAFALAEALERNKTLTHVDLRDNDIDEQAMKRLVLALKFNRTLLHFSVYDAAEGHSLQHLLDHSCSRNRSDMAHLQPVTNSVPLTHAQLVKRLAWDVSLVRGWLEKLQLPSVIPIFTHYGVDGERLLSLGLQDLRDMQVEPRDVRVGLMDAIAAVKARLQQLIRIEAGGGVVAPAAKVAEVSDTELRMRELGNPKKDNHPARLRAQCTAAVKRSPLASLKKELEQLTAEEEIASQAASQAPSVARSTTTTSTPRLLSRPASASTPRSTLLGTPRSAMGLTLPLTGWGSPTAQALLQSGSTQSQSGSWTPHGSANGTSSAQSSVSATSGLLPFARVPSTTTPQRPHSAGVRPSPREFNFSPSNIRYADRPIVQLVRSQYA